MGLQSHDLGDFLSIVPYRLHLVIFKRFTFMYILCYLLCVYTHKCRGRHSRTRVLDPLVLEL